MPEQSQERQVAVKLRIKEIEEGVYITKEGWKPNYLLTKKGEKIARVNLMGVILDKEEKGGIINLILDDGSGKIIVRSFEEIKYLNKVNIGEGVLVIGKIRVFNNDKYISPEIVKKIDAGWLKVRVLELARRGGEEKVEVKEKGKKEFEEEEFLDLKNKKIKALIEELDKGEGALIEEVKEKSKMDKIEELLEIMLKKGEVFRNLPGRVKIL